MLKVYYHSGKEGNEALRHIAIADGDKLVGLYIFFRAVGAGVWKKADFDNINWPVLSEQELFDTRRQNNAFTRIMSTEEAIIEFPEVFLA